MGHAGVGWVMKGWGGVGHVGVRWVMVGWIMVGWKPQNKGPGMLRGQSLIISRGWMGGSGNIV